MAISQSRIKLPDLVTIKQENFSSASDTETVANVKSLSSAQTVSKKSILAQPTVKNDNPTSSPLSIFEDILCNGFKPLNIRLPKFRISLFRDLNFGFNVTICGKKKTLRPIDTALEIAKPLATGRAFLPAAKESLLNNIIAADGRSAMRNLGLGGALPDCLLGNTKGRLVNNTGPVGGSLKSKLSLLDLLNSSSCAGTVLAQPGINTTVSDLTMSAMLDNMIKADTNTAVGFTSTMMADAHNREMMLGGMKQTLTAKNDNSTNDKLLLASTVFSNSTPSQVNTQSVYIRTDGSQILDNLAKNDVTHNSPVTQTKYTMAALDTIDPNWSRDTEGNTNLYKTKDNSTMVSMSSSTLLSTQPKGLNLSGNVVTELDRTKQIAVVNMHHVA